MFQNPSLFTRIAIGKAIGMIVGLAGMIALPSFMPEAGWLLRWGVLLWYTTLGGIVGLFGVFTRHPVLDLPMPWWVRAPFVGAWMNFVLTFFAYDTMRIAMEAFFGQGSPLASPFWFTLEGAVFGLVVGYCATRFGGEGTAAVAGDTAEGQGA